MEFHKGDAGRETNGNIDHERNSISSEGSCIGKVNMAFEYMPVKQQIDFAEISNGLLRLQDDGCDTMHCTTRTRDGNMMRSQYAGEINIEYILYIKERIQDTKSSEYLRRKKKTQVAERKGKETPEGELTLPTAYSKERKERQIRRFPRLSD